MTRYGFDALGRPCTPEEAARLGFTFVGHYLGFVARADVDAYHQAGLDVFLFHEHNANDATGGYLAGRQHGEETLHQLDALGAPVGAALAVDYFPTDVSFVPFFQGAQEVLGARCGGYGDFDVVEALGRAGLCPAGLVQSVSGSPGGSGPRGWANVTLSTYAHLLQHNDAVPPDAPLIPGQALQTNYDLEQQLVGATPLLWRASGATPSVHPTPQPVVPLPTPVLEDLMAGHVVLVAPQDAGGQWALWHDPVDGFKRQWMPGPPQETACFLTGAFGTQKPGQPAPVATLSGIPAVAPFPPGFKP